MPTLNCVYCHEPFTIQKGRALYCKKHRGISSFNIVASNARKRAIKYGLTQHYTGAELFDLVERYGWVCMRCGKTESGFMDHVADHIIPLSMGGPNTIDNIQILCFSCNGTKRNYTIDYRQFAKPVAEYCP